MIRVLFFFFPTWVFGAICFFVPPEGWEFAQHPPLSSHIQIGFLGKSESPFRPSLNLAIEEVDVSLKEYLKAVREIHESEMHIQWRDLGAFSFQAGPGRLTEMTSSSPAGEIKMLQGILVQGGCAYILTGAALTQDFPSLRATLLTALRSLTLVPDLLSAIGNQKERASLQERFHRFKELPPSDREKEWEHLQQIVLKDFPALGSYWHLLVLKEGHRALFQDATRQKLLPQ